MQTVKRFDEVKPRVSFPSLEVELMETWKREQTFERSLALRKDAPRFVFYEGPPTANGRPGTHHILARAFKDLFPRYKTMKGFLVERKAGWDTHGLPVELEVEKKLGISGKQQIEEFGVERFNQLCRESVYEYVEEWVRFSERMAFWQDYDHAYWTLTSEYIQSVWWALKRMWEQGLVYKGFRVAPYCPRCATPLSSHELAQGYRDNVPDPSVYVRFRLRTQPDTSILAWTTTPWTLPGNVALAVGNDIDYVKVRQGNEQLILAEARLSILDSDYEVVERMKGDQLVGLEYEPLYRYMLPEEYKAFLVVDADFVSVDDGTGVVHTSAAYGADDLRLCQEKGVLVRHTVDLRGRFFLEVEKFAGMFVKDADPRITEDLRERGLIYKAGTIHHTYPFCWRCNTPLIYYALDAWYIRTTELKHELVGNNAETNWVPEHIKDGRMGEWLRNNVDWQFSRTRYWGTPVPFWVCDDCGEMRVVDSAAELGLAEDADLHRPYIDELTLTCQKCGGTAHRVPEVLDCWFDSGSMPFAQRGYPHRGTPQFEATFPADFIAEAIDQTRGWFYSLLAISSLLFERNSYRNVICLGHVVDLEGKKHSKSRGNVLDPNYLFETFGSDAVRWFFYTSTTVGENYRTDPDVLQEVVRQFLLPLWNVYSFFVTYANVDGFDPKAGGEVPYEQRPALDRWLLSRLARLTQTVDDALAAYDVNGASRPIQGFAEDLSNWYVRRSRRRFWKSESDQDKRSAYQTLYTTLVHLAGLMAPFTPFVADAMYRNLGGGSVHLSDFPVADPGWIDQHLETEMAAARRYVEQGLAARDAARIKVRQPLRRLEVPSEELPEELAAIVRDELNLKELRFGGAELRLDTEIDEELRLEGLARDAVRLVNDLRKRAGLNVEDRIRLRWEAKRQLAEALVAHADYVAREVLAVEVERGRADGLEQAEARIGGEELWIGLTKA
ncbi:MAG TPA: isoleucine--tRNA ligase [Candidatus Dormibacteraeota bacterium]